jgi:hypothetical protein
VHHCQQSQAGLFYADRWEFTEALKLMVRDRQVHAALGRNGRAYVSDRYRWPTVLGKFERMFERLRMPGRGERAEPPEPDAATVAMSSRPAGSDRRRPRDRGHLRPRDRPRGRAHDLPRQRRRDRRQR